MSQWSSSHLEMNWAVIGWIYLSIVCQGKVIIINNEGSSNNSCCQMGECTCSSFFDALSYLDDDTSINITSQVVILDKNVTIQNLKNIKLLGNNAVVNCTTRANVYCSYCSNVVMEGIIWHHCGFPYVGVGFFNAANVLVSNCKFMFSEACMAALFSLLSGYIRVQKSQFLFNYFSNISDCPQQGALFIQNAISGQDTSITITETIFQHNGALDNTKTTVIPYSSLNIYFMYAHKVDIFIQSTIVSSSIGIGFQLIAVKGYWLNLTIHNSSVVANDGLGIFSSLNEFNINFLELWKVNCSHNNFGCFEVTIANIAIAFNSVNITSSNFLNNTNGCLKFVFKTYSKTYLLLSSSTISGNKGAFGNDPLVSSTSVGQGTGILFYCASCGNSIAIIESCNISDNVGNRSIVYFMNDGGSEQNLYFITQITITSSNFTNNLGSALSFSRSNVTFEGYLLFSNNSAQSGGGIYFSINSQATIDEQSTIEFVNNYASQYGGAIYIDLPGGCVEQGMTFTQLPNSSVVSLTNNSAQIAGNSLYISIPKSCVVSDTSLLYTLYEFNFTQLPESTEPPIITSPLGINMCSTGCNGHLASNCSIKENNMLGEPIMFNATVCDHYNNVSEAVQFHIACTDCDNNFRPTDSKILIQNGSSQFVMMASGENHDFALSRNITINLTSVSIPQGTLTAMLVVEMSTCHSGYVFDASSHQCECYDHSEIIQCAHSNVEIKYGYWFGMVSSTKRSVSLCPTYYCEFSRHLERGNGYYILPSEQNDQCSSHRVGMACGECSVGYTLAYDAIECISTERCSTGMIVLTVFLTILYWIAIVAAVFGLMYLKSDLSLGYLYGVTFYYSVVDILLGANLYISYGVFQFTTILTSSAKLAPQFLGQLCFIQDSSGIDQQFIHYVHAIGVFLLIMVIVMAARCSVKISLFIGRCIIRVVCLLLLLSYTSFVSTSLQLLRPLYYHDLDDVYVYLSPSIKYFTGRHVVYCIVACCCELFIAVGFPLLLLLQPFLKSKVNFIKIKPLLDQFQGCYKDHLHCFASYYLICRQVLIAIAFNSDFDNALYYLQAVSILIVTIHVWVQPYKSDTLNTLDGIILLIMILIINLQSYSFASYTIVTLVIILVILPLCISLLFFTYFYVRKVVQMKKAKKLVNL